MAKKIDIFEIQRRIKEAHGDVVQIDASTYKGTHEKARFIDADFGEWWAIPKNVYALKNGHPKKRAKKISKSKTLSIDKIKEKLFQISGDLVTIDESTWINTTTKCRFIDKEHGEWFTNPFHVLYGGCRHPNGSQKRKEETTLKHYGVKHPSQDKEVALKASRSSKNSYIKKHWQTGETLVCTGSWEARTVDKLNNDMIRFEWQPKVFDMPDGKTYRPDFYLTEDDRWIEIKGRFRIIDKQKWDWFQSIMPNSELWNKEVLKNKGIL